MCSGEFEASLPLNRKKLASSNVLIIGAGGLGCELLKDLALLGFRRLSIIDMDRIDVSNLNRQFLFRDADVGQWKAEIAAKRVLERLSSNEQTFNSSNKQTSSSPRSSSSSSSCSSSSSSLKMIDGDDDQDDRRCLSIEAYTCRIEQKPSEFYAQFDLIVCGLDSIAARRWINSVLVDLVRVDDDGAIVDANDVVPLIDGGTEGVKGQARVIVPRITGCFECSLDSFPPQRNYPVCTLAHTPRIAEHCIEWASLMHWRDRAPFGDGTPVDGDNPEHMQWLYEAASRRADEHGIGGVTYKLTQGVVKHIIPAVAATNALVAAACANEAFKYVSGAATSIDNFMMVNQGPGVYTHTFDYRRKPDCPVCSAADHIATVDIEPSATLGELIESLAANPSLQLSRPSLRHAATSKSLYMQAPPSLELATRANLKQPLSALLGTDEIQHDIDYTDPSLSRVSNVLRIRFIWPVGSI
jgi:NEDD8-activating enzyme E1